jgi:ABC-type transport system involved in multi-copper enzyme maturation permease subunit
MQRLAGTDIREFDHFMEGVRRHWDKYIERWAFRYTDFKQYQEAKLPEFGYVVQSAGECIAQTLHQWVILFLLSVIFFVTAHMVFVKRDIG